MTFFSKISGFSSYLPKKVITNEELSKTVDTTHEWIIQRTGISSRHIADDAETVSYMAIQSCLSLLKKSNTDPSDIDLIVVSSSTPNFIFPSVSCLVQDGIGAKKGGIAIDIRDACSGFINALINADNFIKLRKAKKAIVVGVEKMSDIVDWSDRSTCVLFGDGAGSVLLESMQEEVNPEEKKQRQGIIDSFIASDGSIWSHLFAKSANNTLKSNTSHFVQMNGKEIFKIAVPKMTEAILTILNKNHLSIGEIKAIVPHQANQRIISAVAKNLGVDDDKFVVTVGQHANTSAASIPLALDFAFSSGFIKQGDLIILEAIGAGMTWGGMLVRI